jgi:uncharacterized protein (TIGR03437 family)
VGDAFAPLLFVSPAQINYLLPSSAGSIGSAGSGPSISIERDGSPFVESGLAILARQSDVPGFFTANSSGLAAATAVRVASDGSKNPVPVMDCTSGGCKAVPIDTSGDPVYLSLYGTGFVNFPSANLSSTSPRLECGFVSISYYGPQGQIPGLAQVNMIPAILGSPVNTPPLEFSINCTLTVFRSPNTPILGYPVAVPPVHILLRRSQ